MPVVIRVVSNERRREGKGGDKRPGKQDVSPMSVAEDPGLDRPPRQRPKPPAFFLADVRMPGQ